MRYLRGHRALNLPATLGSWRASARTSLQFEAVSRLDNEEKKVVRSVLEGLLFWPAVAEAREWLHENGGKGIPHHEAMRRLGFGVVEITWTEAALGRLGRSR